MREHGQMVTYRFGIDGGSDSRNGCRCDPCRRAISDYERERRQRTAPPYVSATTAREHIAYLRTQGVGVKTIAERAGVSHGGISKLVYGNYKGRRPSKRIRKETSDRILAVMPSARLDGSRVPAERTWQIVGELLERGWTKSAIARAIGQTSGALQLGRRYVTGAHAHAIDALLDEPVPPRRSRHGLHPVTQPTDELAPQPAPAQLPTVDLDPSAPWRQRAACRFEHVPGWIFHPGRGDHETTAAAKAVCASCPVAADCLEANLRERFGVWGGTTEAERRRIRRERGIPDEDRGDDESEVA